MHYLGNESHGKSAPTGGHQGTVMAAPSAATTRNVAKIEMSFHLR
jgi:hypothetical protein